CPLRWATEGIDACGRARVRRRRSSSVCPPSVLALQPPTGILCVPSPRPRPRRIEEQQVTFLSLTLAKPARIDAVELFNDSAGQPRNRIRIAPVHVAPYGISPHRQLRRPSAA